MGRVRRLGERDSTRPAPPFLASIAALVLAGVGPAGLCSSAELAPEVAEAFAAGRTQQVIIHLAADTDTKMVLGRAAGAADERRLNAVARASPQPFRVHRNHPSPAISIWSAAFACNRP